MLPIIGCFKARLELSRFLFGLDFLRLQLITSPVSLTQLEVDDAASLGRRLKLALHHHHHHTCIHFPANTVSQQIYNEQHI